jgi:hypothetical protein
MGHIELDGRQSEEPWVTATWALRQRTTEEENMSATSIDCGVFDSRGPSVADQITRDATRPKKTRIRKRSISIQLQQALDDAAKAMSADISVQKLIQTRIACLLKMQARERHDKLKRALSEVTRLTAENERLNQELAKPAARPLTEVEQVLAKYEASKKKNGGQ